MKKEIIVNRLKKLRQQLPEQEIDAFFISKPENIYYLSGFDSSDGFLLITPQDTILATDFRYIEQAQRQASSYEIFQITSDIADWFPRLIADLNLKRLGFESRHITFTLYQQLNESLDKHKPQLKLVPVDKLVESIRTIKELEEIEFITRASEISDGALEYIREIINIDMTEKEIAWEIEKFMRQRGSQAVPFELIVASGANSALPHAKPSEHTISPGEPIVIDIGARIEGYSSDLTRTICLGKPDDTFNRIYEIVLRAQLKAIAAIKEGMSGKEANSSAREVIDQAGYGEAFGHSLGHGVGLAPHELPRLSPNAPERLTNGMVFTVEPGIYLSGWGGVRIEDTVVMEYGKIRTISKSPK